MSNNQVIIAQVKTSSNHPQQPNSSPVTVDWTIVICLFLAFLASVLSSNRSG